MTDRLADARAFSRPTSKAREKHPRDEVGEGVLPPYNGLFEAAPPERGSFFRLQVYESIGFHENTLELSERVGKTVILGLSDAFYGC